MLDLAQLRSLVMHSTQPTGAQFYRKFYKMAQDAPPLSIDSHEDWLKVPLLPKAAISDLTLAERTFIPLSELDHLRASSGTSGWPPVFSPRTHVRGMDYRLQYHDFKNAFLAFTIPMMPHWHEIFQKEHGMLPRVIAHDPRYPDAAARLAKLAGADALSVFVFHIGALGEALKKVGHADKIRFVEIAGEVCSHAQYDYMRATFPNATIVQSYASSEVEDVHIGMPCRAMTGEEPLAVYHQKETHLLELLDTETGEIVEPVPGAIGDLLVTAYPGEPASFPMIRYQIGDTVQVVEARCAHGSWSYTVLGRTDLDFLKVAGGIIRADEIARVLRTMPYHVSDNFELHCSEKVSGAGVQLEPTLRIELRAANVDLKALANDIASLMRVSPVMTYAQGVAAGRYAPLVCEPLEADGSGKSKRIVRHADSKSGDILAP